MKLRHLIILFCVCINVSVSAADMLVVTRQDSDISSVTVTELSQLWLKQIHQLAGVKAEVADLFEKHPLREKYYASVVGKSANKLSAYWSIRVFRGEGFPPPSFQSIEDLIIWIAAKKNRLGYIESRYLNEQLKTVYNVTSGEERAE